MIFTKIKAIGASVALVLTATSTITIAQEQFRGDGDHVYFKECSGKYQNGETYIGKVIHCLTVQQEKSICDSEKSGVSLSALKMLGSYAEVRGQDPNRYINQLVENRSFKYSIKWDGSNCKVTLSASGMVNGNTINRTLYGKIGTYYFNQGEFVGTLISPID